MINLNLDQMWEPVSVGIRRAYVFAGLGTNAALSPDLNNFHLPGLIKFSFVFHTATSELLADYKHLFGSWILASAFREMLEAYAVTIDSVYVACAVTEAVAGHAVEKARLRSFEFAGVERKLEILEKEFEIPSRTRPYLVSLNKFRNCLSHRMGRVGPQDCDETGKLVLRFAHWDYLIAHPDGSETVIPPDVTSPLFVRRGGTIAVRMSETTKDFAEGSQIVLECWLRRSTLW